MTHQDNRGLASYITEDGAPQFETHFALFNLPCGQACLCAFEDSETREMAIAAAFERRRHAQAVKHVDAFTMAQAGAAMWFRLETGDLAPLQLNQRRGVPALRLVEVANQH